MGVLLYRTDFEEVAAHSAIAPIVFSRGQDCQRIVRASNYPLNP